MESLLKNILTDSLVKSFCPPRIQPEAQFLIVEIPAEVPPAEVPDPNAAELNFSFKLPIIGLHWGFTIEDEFLLLVWFSWLVLTLTILLIQFVPALLDWILSPAGQDRLKKEVKDVIQRWKGRFNAVKDFIQKCKAVLSTIEIRRTNDKPWQNPLPSGSPSTDTTLQSIKKDNLRLDRYFRSLSKMRTTFTRMRERNHLAEIKALTLQVQKVTESRDEARRELKSFLEIQLYQNDQIMSLLDENWNLRGENVSLLLDKLKNRQCKEDSKDGEEEWKWREWREKVDSHLSDRSVRYRLFRESQSNDKGKSASADDLLESSPRAESDGSWEKEDEEPKKEAEDPFISNPWNPPLSSTPPRLKKKFVLK